MNGYIKFVPYVVAERAPLKKNRVPLVHTEAAPVQKKKAHHTVRVTAFRAVYGQKKRARTQ